MPGLWSEQGPQEDRQKEIRTRWRFPGAAQPAPARRLVIGDGHDAFGGSRPGLVEQVAVGRVDGLEPADIDEPGLRHGTHPTARASLWDRCGRSLPDSPSWA